MSKLSEKRAYWSSVLSRFHASNQTQKAFCESENLKLATFHYWLDQSRKKPISASMPSNRTGRFARIALKPNGPSPGYQIKLPNGISCILPQGFDAAEMSKLLEVLLRC